MNHEQRIAELHATYDNGRVAENVYFVAAKSRFRVKMNGKWIGTFWTYKGAVEARNSKRIEELEAQIAVLKTELEEL